MLGEQGVELRGIVPGRNEDALSGLLKNAGGIRLSLGEGAQLRRAQAHLPLIAHAVIAALKLDDEIAAGMGPSQTDGKHIGLATGRNVAELLGTGHGFANPFGQFDPLRIVGKEREAIAQLFFDGLDDFGVAMPQQHGARADQVVDVLVAFDIPYAGPLTVLDHQRRVEVAKATAGQHGLCAISPG